MHTNMASELCASSSDLSGVESDVSESVSQLSLIYFATLHRYVIGNGSDIL